MDWKKAIATFILIIGIILLLTGVGAVAGVPILAYAVYSYGRDIFLDKK